MGKSKVIIDLDQYEFDLFKEAVNTMSKDNPSREWERMFLEKAIVAVAEAVIREGLFLDPVALDLRTATKSEIDRRKAKVLPERWVGHREEYFRVCDVIRNLTV